MQCCSVLQYVPSNWRSPLRSHTSSNVNDFIGNNYHIPVNHQCLYILLNAYQLAWKKRPTSINYSGAPVRHLPRNHRFPATYKPQRDGRSPYSTDANPRFPFPPTPTPSNRDARRKVAHNWTRINNAFIPGLDNSHFICRIKFGLMGKMIRWLWNLKPSLKPIMSTTAGF